VKQAPIPKIINELWELIVAYLKQETVVPLRQLGRYVAWGVAGAILLGLGVIFLALAVLRALQETTGRVFTGAWSWAPYFIVVAVLVIGALVTWLARNLKGNRA
jgi:cytochrome b subunit of formate dehydrogenase